MAKKLENYKVTRWEMPDGEVRFRLYRKGDVMGWDFWRELVIVLMFVIVVLSMTMLFIHDPKWALIFMGAVAIWGFVRRKT